MISVDVFVLVPGESDVVDEESRIADIAIDNRFIGSSHIVFSSKGSFVGVRLLGCFPSVEAVETTFEQLNAVEHYELIG